MTPTQRSLKVLRDEGWTVEVVERWVPGANVRRDLFGVLDLLALRDGVTLGVQVTSDNNVAARIHKIADHPNLPALRTAGWALAVHGWRKSTKTNRWQLRVVDVS